MEYERKRDIDMANATSERGPGLVPPLPRRRGTSPRGRP